MKTCRNMCNKDVKSGKGLPNVYILNKERQKCLSIRPVGFWCKNMYNTKQQNSTRLLDAY